MTSFTSPTVMFSQMTFFQRTSLYLSAI
jgi:hypothetical protein